MEQNKNSADLPPSADKEQLKGERVRFGLGTILYQSEEIGLGPVPTAIVRSLGGDDRHIGLIGTASSLGGLVALLADPFLKWKRSNRGAMIFAMGIGFVLAMLICLTLLLAYNEAFRPYAIYTFLVLSITFGGVSSLQSTIEKCWIGDLVHESVRGWFTKIKWILSILGVLFFGIFIARFTDRYPVFGGYAVIYGMFAVSFLIAALFIYPRIADRTPRTANYFSEGSTLREKLKNSDGVLWVYMHDWVIWLYTLHGFLWMLGRQAFFAFTAAYLIEYFNYSMTRIVLLSSIQSIMSIAVLYAIGDKSDVWGVRKPWLILMAISALSMSFWIFSAKWGLVCIIIFYVLAGASGHTLSMLGMNYNLYMTPAKGRSTYYAIGGIIGIPIALLTASSIGAAGWILHHFKTFHFEIAGATFSRYHVYFLCCMTICFLGLVPLLIIGNRRIGDGISKKLRNNEGV
ncbi:MAG: MFS transporter [Fibrobacteres bacterium]|nr:MFS transporter [Fibrobacterota bacterium]